MALGRSPPQAGTPGGLWVLGTRHAHLPDPTPAAQVGWAQPHGRGWGGRRCLPSRRHSGAVLAPHLLPQSVQGVHEVLLYLYPHSRLHSGRDIGSRTRRRQLTVPELSLRPTPSLPGELGPSHGIDSLRKCADFCPFAKKGNRGAEGGSGFDGRPDRKAGRGLPADRASSPCCHIMWLFCPIPSIFADQGGPGLRGGGVEVTCPGVGAGRTQAVGWLPWSPAGYRALRGQLCRLPPGGSRPSCLVQALMPDWRLQLGQLACLYCFTRLVAQQTTMALRGQKVCERKVGLCAPSSWPGLPPDSAESG